MSAATGNVRASLAREGFATESTTAAATAEERKSQRVLEEAALDAAVAITQVHGFFGERLCENKGRYGRPARPKRLIGRGRPKFRVAWSMNWR